jgi:replicative DNA helicase
MLTDKKIFIDEYSNTVARVAANARRIKRTQGDLGLIVIDYLGLMDGTGENKVQEIASITKGLKRLSKEMGIPVIVLAQLNRQVENRPNKRPLMSDLRDSGAIEQDADVIVTPFRDHYYTGNPETEGMAEIIVMKNRMGMTGTALAVFDGRHGCFIPACESAAAKYHRAMSENNTPAPAPKKTANTGFHLPA